jgi:hypothetical protein
MRGRVSSALILIALSLVSLAGVNLSSVARYVVLTVAFVALAIAAWLLIAERREMRRETRPSPGRLRIAILATASVLAWGALGVTAAKEMWTATLAALVAVMIVTGALWRLIRSTRASAEL